MQQRERGERRRPLLALHDALSGLVTCVLFAAARNAALLVGSGPVSRRSLLRDTTIGM
jgi:hypothetical protein